MNLADAMRRSGSLQRRTGVRVNDWFVLEGGLNLVDPPLAQTPGGLLTCRNYEPGPRGGYRRVDGFERFDGRPSPTRADYWTITVDGVTADPFVLGYRLRQYAIGETVFNNSTQIADGVVVSINDLGDGTFVIGVVETTDTTEFDDGFDQDGDIYTADVIDAHPGTLVGVSSQASRNSAPTNDLNVQIISDKTEFYRADIETVGGSLCTGKVLGVAIYKDRVVAWRNAISGTEALMFQTDTNAFTGWQQVNLGYKIYFDEGGPEIEEGDTITGASSGATAIAKRIVSDDGSYVGLDASGFIIVNSITGAFIANEDLNVGGVKHAQYLSSAAQSLLPNGRYRTRVHNFAGAGDKTRLYGVNTVNRAFEYDGTTFVLIETGMAVDTPDHIFVLNNHLGLTFPGGSVQNSGYQTPLNWSPVLGADERSIGGDVTELKEGTNNTVFIATRNSTYVYYGDVVENFQLRLFSPTTGMLPDTAGEIGHTIFLDDQGFSTLKSAQEYGNFKANSISDKIQPLLSLQLSAHNVAGNVIARSKNLYRFFFSDGTGLAINTRAGNKLSGWTPIKYPVSPTCFDSGELEYPVAIIPGQTQNPGPIFPERVFMGALDGYVYEMDIGSSFDGGDIEYFMHTAYHHSRTPDRFKHYRKATIDIDVDGPVTLFVTVDFNYGNRTGQVGLDANIEGGGGIWNVSNWDQFKWAGAAFDQISLKIEGDGYNIGMYFYGKSSREMSHTIHNLSYHHSIRRINRGSTSA